MIEHSQVVAMLSWAGRVFSHEELSHTLAATSVSFDLSVFEIFAPLSVGGTVALGARQRAGPDRTSRLVRGRDVRSTRSRRSPGTCSQPGAIPPRARTMNLAGEPLAPHLVEELYAHPVIGVVNNLYWAE
ncbi:Linear gramicidin synthase subunit B [Streptomyces griseoloalbus]